MKTEIVGIWQFWRLDSLFYVPISYWEFDWGNVLLLLEEA